MIKKSTKPNFAGDSLNILLSAMFFGGGGFQYVVIKFKHNLWFLSIYFIL